jgi:carotenoid 1,2-hydratase
MTERGTSSLVRTADEYRLGLSRAVVTDDGLELNIDEVCVPFPTRLQGRVKVRFHAINHCAFHLDHLQRHVWRPIAPCASIDVDFASPRQAWSGRAYVDSNWGSEPVEARFDNWQWSRAEHGDTTCVYYDVNEKDGHNKSIACAFDEAGHVSALPQAALLQAPQTGWRMDRPYRSEAGGQGLIKTVEDTPFYARSLMGQVIKGEKVTAIHESLSVTRFASPIVQMMLPWRMPRRNLAPR